MNLPIIELRQYTLHPGMRDELIELFEREFLESQEAAGNVVLGQFRDIERSDRFVWLRGFRDMPARAQALAEFYGGSVWKANRDAANATMIDSDNVLLLRAVRTESQLPFNERDGAVRDGLVIATIYYLNAPPEDGFIDAFERHLKTEHASSADILGYYVTERSENNFPALPVRSGENVLVCFTRETGATRSTGASFPSSYFVRPPEVLKLRSGARSRL
jgi:quinol monooxygenase YgiN